MQGKRRISALLAVLLVLVGMWGAALSATAASETVYAGDKVAVTGADGHQYYYTAADGTTGYCWASCMYVAVSERNGVDVDYTGGDWKQYYAWCASWGERVPADAQEYVLSEAQRDDNGYYYVDEDLHKDGVQGYRISLDRALSCIKAAWMIAQENGHTSFPKVYRYAIEIAVRCGSDEVKVDKLNITGGWASDAGMKVLDEIGLSVARFYQLVKEICAVAEAHPYVYTPPKTVITTTQTKRNVYEGDYLILGEYELKESGVTAEVRAGSPTGVEAIVAGKKLTVRIPKKDVPLEFFEWNVDLSYVNGDTYKMLFGKPVDKDGNILDTPQNIVLYDTETLVVDTKVNGEYIPNEKVTVTVSKTDEDGNKLPDMSFSLYKVDGSKVNLVKTSVTNANGIAEWKNLDLGYYLLTENAAAGWAAHNPESWDVTGATSKVYTTVGGVTGWLMYLAPGDVAATVSAVNRKTIGDVAIIKSDTKGNRVSGIGFTVYPIADNGELSDPLTGTTNAGGILYFEGLPLGEYMVTENPTDGWVAHNPREWEVSAQTASYTTVGGVTGWLVTLDKDGAMIQAVNERITGSLTVYKKATDNSTLQGAEFALEVSYDGGVSWQALSSGTTGADGTLSFSGLDTSALYRLTETKAPAGYSLQTKPVYTGAVTEAGISVTVKDGLITRLPDCGGIGNGFIGALAALCGAAGLILLTKRKGKK